jgi:hypothetical protein
MNLCTHFPFVPISEEQSMNAQTTSEPTSTTAGRQGNGTFAPGNQFGRGNPFARKSAAFRSALMEAVSERDIKDIAAKLRDDAKAGDKAATKILFQYLIGKPSPTVDPDTLDAQEMRTFAANSIHPEAIAQMQQNVPLGWLTQTWPIYVACMIQKCAQHLDGVFADADAKEEHETERAQQKAERKQQRDEALRAQPTPSTDGDNGSQAAVPPPNEPSTTADFADDYVEGFEDWLHDRLSPTDFDERS